MSSDNQDTPPPFLPVDAAGMIIDRYKLEVLLGAGSMGRVYSAIQTVTKRRCALKLLPENLSANRDFVARFQTEAQLLASLNHPNIVQIYSGGEAQSRYFLEMEYVDGGDLQKRVADLAQGAPKGLPESEVIQITDGVLAALEYSHQHGIVHRDLKPANILLSKSGQVKVSDFGLATVIGDQHFQELLHASQTSPSLANVASLETIPYTPADQSGSFAGTILYMSPQAMRAEPPDPRDDLFSLGIVVYYMLTGKTPAVNYTPVSKIRKDLTFRWDPFIATCLAEDRTNRFASATATRASFAQLRRARSQKLLVVAVALVAAVPVFAVATWKLSSPKASVVLSQLPQSDSITPEPVVDRVVGSVPVSPSPPATSEDPLSVIRRPLPGSNEVVTGSAPGSVVVRPPLPIEVPPVVAPRRTQAITVEPIRDAVLGKPFELVAQSDSGLPVRLAVVSGPAVVRDEKLELRGLGQVTLRITQPGDASFLPADVIEKTFTVQDPLPATLTVTLPGNVEITFVRIPAGRAVLGSAVDEVGHRGEESLHEVSIRQGFLMSTTEVTQGQYDALTGTRPSYFRAGWPSRPVEQVRLADLGARNTGATTGFFPRLNAVLKASGYGNWQATLPSEDEWEYACRAGSATPFANDVDLTVPRNDAAVNRLAVYGRSETSPVASKSPNAWGLYDMHGNVAEWTSEGTLRGGSFRDDPSSIRSASRFRATASTPDRRFGFRVVLHSVD